MELTVVVLVWLAMAVTTFLLGWALRALLRPGDHPSLERVEWLFPIKGRWLRYALAVLVGILFVPLLTVTLVSGIVGTCMVVISR